MGAAAEADCDDVLRLRFPFLSFALSVYLAVPGVAQDISIGNPSPNPFPPDDFGSAVAISGNTAIVGATLDDTGANDAGSVYVYDVATGGLLRTINNPTASMDAEFGNSVDISGNIGIFGAQYDSTGAINAGSAYIYDVVSGSLLHTVNNPTPSLNAVFGRSVAISGNIAIVAAQNDDTNATDAGTVYVYDVTSGGLLRTVTNPTPAIGDTFGSSVAIAGNTLIIGALGDDTAATDAGSVYVYDTITGGLQHTISNPAGQSDFFGSTVAVSGNIAAIGARGEFAGASSAGLVYVYDVTTGTLLRTINNPTPAADEHFGWDVAISDDTLLVGSLNDDAGASGAAFVFDVTTGALLQTLNSPNLTISDNFGRAVAISGNTAIMGAPDAAGDGAAYIYANVGASSVPEVSAAGSLAALATLLALVALLWERRSGFAMENAYRRG